MTDTVRTFWLSFCDSNRPAGSQFLGVCIVDVTEDEAEDVLVDVFFRHPAALPGAEWIAAAIAKAWRVGCNPGGEVGSRDITDRLPFAPCEVPRNRLMSKAEMIERGLIE